MTAQRSTIRTVALICVAITTTFVIGMSIWLTWVIARTDWCGKVVGSSVYTEGRPDFAIKGCVEVMRDQIAALANGSLIFGGVVALCLAALMVIVVAGGRLSFSASAAGVSGNIGRAEDAPTPAEAAQQVATAAVEEADQITGETK